MTITAAVVVAGCFDMARKPLAGKRYFEALGRSHEARDIPFLANRRAMQEWPRWAKQAYCLGRLNNSPRNKG